MNGNFDGVNGMYGSVQYVALAELGRLLNEAGQGRSRSQGFSWKRVALAIVAVSVALAVITVSGALLLAI